MLSSDDSRVLSLIDEIRKYPDRSVRELAKDMDLSCSRVQHIFKRHTGLRMVAYRQERRLVLAAQLLRGTGLSVKEVSHLVGYRHTSSFVRAFSRLYGAPPMKFRN
jgi:AraC-like DNA-binding protein